MVHNIGANTEHLNINIKIAKLFTMVKLYEKLDSESKGVGGNFSFIIERIKDMMRKEAVNASAEKRKTKKHKQKMRVHGTRI
jgi:hypothetical protein